MRQYRSAWRRRVRMDAYPDLKHYPWEGVPLFCFSRFHQLAPTLFVLEIGPTLFKYLYQKKMYETQTFQNPDELKN